MGDVGGLWGFREGAAKDIGTYRAEWAAECVADSRFQRDQG